MRTELALRKTDTLGVFFCLMMPRLASAADGSTFVSESVPQRMTTRVQYSASVTFKNSGTTTWNSGTNPFRLGSQNPHDNTTWGITRVSLNAGKTIASEMSRVSLNAGDTVAVGAQKTFTFTVRAPAKAGLYHFRWKMLHGLTWFGASGSDVAVTVSGQSCSFDLSSLDSPPATGPESGGFFPVAQALPRLSTGAHIKLGAGVPFTPPPLIVLPSNSGFAGYDGLRFVLLYGLGALSYGCNYDSDGDTTVANLVSCGYVEPYQNDETPVDAIDSFPIIDGVTSTTTCSKDSAPPCGTNFGTRTTPSSLTPFYFLTQLRGWPFQFGPSLSFRPIYLWHFPSPQRRARAPMPVHRAE